jgi:hypothetical protein
MPWSIAADKAMTMADGGSEAFDPIDYRLKRLEGDVGEFKSDIKALRSEIRADVGSISDEMHALRDEIRGEFSAIRGEFVSVHRELSLVREGLSYTRGRLDTLPTTIQLLGFIIAIFVASGLTRYFGH